MSVQGLYSGGYGGSNWGLGGGTGGSVDPRSKLLSAISGMGGGGAPSARQDIGVVGVNGAPTGGGSGGKPGGTQLGSSGQLGSGGQLMGAMSGGFAPSVGWGGGPSLTNTAQTPADVQWLINQVKSRATGQAGTGEAIDIAGSKIRDAGQGISKALSAQAAQRGVLGSGAAAQQQGQLASDLQKQVAGSASDIALGRQKDIDQLLLGSQGVMEAPARLGQGDRQLALQQYLGQGGLDLQKYGIDKNALLQQNQQNFAQQSQLMNLLMNLY